MINYPTAQEYMTAVQQPASFRRSELAGARFEVHPTFGIPMPASGTSAVVFKADVAGTTQALRFFTRDDASTRDRYTQLNTYFTQHGLAESVATCRWVDDAIALKGRSWPVVQMQWVDGRTLDQYVEDLVDRGNTNALATLAGNWRELIKNMQAARFAHGDLQHGNVLVDQSGRLRLVDFDCAWIEPFAGTSPPTETGHRNYQHPGRTWGPWMDTFPGLVVYASLLTLSMDRTSWETLHNGDNLLFEQQDFEAPAQTEVWQRMAAIADPQLSSVVHRLKACCTPAWSADGGLEVLLGEEVQLPANAPWWEITAMNPSPFGTPTVVTPPPATGALPPPKPITPERPGSTAMPPIVAPSGQWNPKSAGKPTGNSKRSPQRSASTPSSAMGSTWWANPGGSSTPGPGSQPSDGAGRRFAVAGGMALAIGLAATVMMLLATSAPGPSVAIGILAAFIALIPLLIDAQRPR